MNEFEEKTTRVLAAGLACSGRQITYTSDDMTLAELKSLIKTAGGETVAVLLQNRDLPDPATFFGSGKVEELRDLATNLEADLIVVDNELSPAQIKNLEDQTGVRVIDRSMLILDIFALHAVTKEGKLQVQMAQLKYTMPRLTGRGTELSRLGGGIGTRGPGESQLEIDRRHVKERIRAIQEQLDEVRRTRQEQRRARDASGLPKVAVIGYTNAGKSTLLNYLTGAGILAEDKLFATLDTTTRKLKMENGFEVLLTDTVGFIRSLPHHLIEAFASTLDEVRYADLLIEVIDASDPDHDAHIEVCEKLVEQLGGGTVPLIRVYNKMDKLETPMLLGDRESVVISAKSGFGVDTLLSRIYSTLTGSMRTFSVLIPYDKGGLLERIFADAVVHEQEYRESGTYLRLTAKADLYGKLEPYHLPEEMA